MLRADYTEKVSILRDLAASLKGETGDNKVSSGHTFYREGIEVAHMYNFMSGPSRIEVGKDVYLFNRKNRVVFFTQYYRLEHDGETMATAKESIRFLGSKSMISYVVDSRAHNLTLKTGIRNLSGRRYQITEGDLEIGIIEHDSDLGADIDLLPQIPLSLQIFIYTVSFRMWQRGR